MLQISISPIGVISTPFKQKFAIPRQPNLADAEGTITLTEAYRDPTLFKGIEGFSHLWLLFYFNATAAQGYKPAVKAPRLGGNKTLGVFASRSMFRPNAIGMSVVRNLGWQSKNGQLLLNVEGVDLLDQTPILDIKPYLSYSDSIEINDEEANSSPYSIAPPTKNVFFSTQASQQLATLNQQYPRLKRLIIQVLSQDPRPAYKQLSKVDTKEYRVQLYDQDIHWVINKDIVTVSWITQL